MKHCVYPLESFFLAFLICLSFLARLLPPPDTKPIPGQNIYFDPFQNISMPLSV